MWMTECEAVRVPGLLFRGGEGGLGVGGWVLPPPPSVIGAAKGKQPNTEALCQEPPPHPPPPPGGAELLKGALDPTIGQRQHS